MSINVEQLAAKLEALQLEVADLRHRLQAVTPSANLLSIAEKVRIVNEARATGNRAQLIRAHRQINGESPL